MTDDLDTVVQLDRERRERTTRDLRRELLHRGLLPDSAELRAMKAQDRVSYTEEGDPIVFAGGREARGAAAITALAEELARDGGTYDAIRREEKARHEAQRAGGNVHERFPGGFAR